VNTPSTIKAVAIASGFFASSVSSAAYTISSRSAGSINFGNGFAAGGMILNGTAALNGSRVRLTDGGNFEAASAWYGSQVSVSSFTKNFSFQLVPGTNTLADSSCYVIQTHKTTAHRAGPSGWRTRL
jgi:hypothetical protein